MSKVIPFQFAGSLTVRSLLIDDAPWFIAGDVCRAIDLADTNKALLGLDADEKREHEQYSGSGRKPLLINESGLYSLILRSRKPEAKAFKKWVTNEVLPALRKTGAYSVSPPVSKTPTQRAGRGTLAPEFYPPWPLSDDDLQPLTKAQVAELAGAVRAVASQFYSEHKAAWALRKKIEGTFGAIIPDLEAWQFNSVRKFITVIGGQAQSLKAQIASFEDLFWDQYTYNGLVDLVPAIGQVFQPRLKARR